MASVIIPIIPIQTPSYASTLVTRTRAAAVSVPTSTTSDFVLSATAGGSSRRPDSESPTTIALAMVVPLVALIAFISVIVFRMYRTRKEREEAATAAAAKAKTKAIEQQIYDMESISEKLNLDKYRITPGVKEIGNAKDLPELGTVKDGPEPGTAKGVHELGTTKDITMDIPIELEADEPEKRQYHGL
jgi:hypothetical protein